jgi:peptidyl-prolyl cis-trans isomerase SurA
MQIRTLWARGSAALLLLFLGLAAAAQAPSVRTGSQPVDRVVAVVNDEVITANELRQRTAIVEQQLRRQRIALPPANVLQRQVLERMIVERAQLQLARETGVRVDDATVNAAMARMAETNNMTLPQFRARLDQEGMSFARFRDEIRNEIIMSRLREREVDGRIQIAEGEVDNFLADQKGGAGDVEYNIAQILLRVPDNASTEQIEATRRRAEDLLRQLKGGADFGALAASFSSSPDALSGGDLGWRSAERLPTLFVEAVAPLKPGEIAPLVRSPGGFHVLKLVGKRGAGSAGQISNAPVTQTHVRHILLRVTDVTPEPDVVRRLNDLRDRVVKGGQDFGQVARLHSVDGSATRGGDLGWLYPGDTVPEFERAMNQLKLGEVSEPVKSPFGWHLIQVTERRTEEVPVERNRLLARQALRERKAEEAYQEWLRQLRDRTYVELRLEDA